METYIVTIKLPKHPSHNPRSKVTGECPVSLYKCTDQTGEHHSVLVNADSISAVRHHFAFKGVHVTRIEHVIYDEVLTIG